MGTDQRGKYENRAQQGIGERETDRQRDRDRDTDTDRHRETERDRETEIGGEEIREWKSREDGESEADQR